VQNAAKLKLKLKEIFMNTKKCPVCDWDINDGGIKVNVGGKEITVCCDDCATKAEESPAKYAEATA
jgi:ribosome-binding protein aMBF1 (putative translation factor)